MVDAQTRGESAEPIDRGTGDGQHEQDDEAAHPAMLPNRYPTSAELSFGSDLDGVFMLCQDW